MSFFKMLFGGNNDENGIGEPAPSVDYNGYRITPSPQEEGQQFRLAGTISKDLDGVEKSHLLIRADMFSSRESAIEATVKKARQVIDEQGDAIFT